VIPRNGAEIAYMKEGIYTTQKIINIGATQSILWVFSDFFQS
jgi:hypothetical protein